MTQAKPFEVTASLRQSWRTPLNPFSKEHFSLFIEIRDYPGEWLLDLPLRNMDYARWSGQCSAQFNKEPRKQILGDLLLDLQNIDPMDPVDFSVLADLKKQFVSFLKHCKAGERPLSLLQPGRFLMPGHVDDETLLCFVPLLKADSFTDGQLEEVGGASIASHFSVILSQGLGVGIYSAKIGLATIAISRPMELVDNKPDLKSLTRLLIDQFKSEFKSQG